MNGYISEVQLPNGNTYKIRDAEAVRGNYLPLVDDLDNYDCPVGTIVKYNGETNEKYVNGWDYKKVKTDSDNPAVIEPNTLCVYVSPNAIVEDNNIKNEIVSNPYFYKSFNVDILSDSNNTYFEKRNGSIPEIGDYVHLNAGFWDKVAKIRRVVNVIEHNYSYEVELDDGQTIFSEKDSINYRTLPFYFNSYNFSIYVGFGFNQNNPVTKMHEGAVIRTSDGIYMSCDASDGESKIYHTSENITLPQKPSWIQHNAQPDISGQVSNLETTVANNSQNILSLQSGKQDKITATNKLSYDLLKDTPQIPTVPTKLSEFTDDLSVGKNPTHTHNQYLTSYTETDPTVPSHVKAITQQNITDWNNSANKAHQQNTDTMLASGKLKVESNKISATLPIVSSGDIEGKDTTTNTTHLLSKKLNADMLRMYSSWSAMESDKNNIPEGAWVAITEY